MRASTVGSLAATVVLAGSLSAQTQTPVFRSGVDLVAVDVQVVDRTGQPITTLTARDFEVFIDGRRRPVESVTVVDYGRRDIDLARRRAPGAEAASPSASGAEAAAPRRFYLLAVDETSFDIKNAPIAMQAARRFVDGLLPRDFVALYSYPVGGAHTNLTTNHALVKSAIDRVTGVKDLSFGQFHMTPTEFIDIAAGDAEVRNRVVARECGATVTRCSDSVLAEARGAVAYYEGIAAQSLGSLRGVLKDFEKVEGSKTIVVVTGGMIQSDRGSRPDNSNLLKQVGEWAGAANTSFYVIFMDTSFLDAFSALRRGAPNAQTLLRDSNILGIGLERVVDSAGGELIRVQAGTGDAAFERVLRETTAYYVLGVAPDDRDRDGRTHVLRVELAQGGPTLRSRKYVVIPKR